MDEESELDKYIESLKDSILDFGNYKITANELLELAKALNAEIKKDIQI